MKVSYNLNKRGFNINVNNHKFGIHYPIDVWKNFTSNKSLYHSWIDNLVYARTINFTLNQENKNIYFNFPTPMLKTFFDISMFYDIPRIIDEDGVRLKHMMKKILNSKTIFENHKTEFPFHNSKLEEGAVIAASFGKDSLLSYGLAKEIGLNPKLVFVDDKYDDAESNLKRKIMKRFSKEVDDVFLIEDETDKFYDKKGLNKDNLSSCSTNAMNLYTMMLLPFNLFFKSKYIVLGNEQNLNDYFIDKDGIICYPSPDQTSNWIKQQEIFIRMLSSNKAKVVSLIEPLYNIAEMKILHNRYENIGKYQMSCMLEGIRSSKKLWCQKCAMCCKAFLFFKAIDIDPKGYGYTDDLFKKKCIKYYPLFSTKGTRTYEKPLRSRDEQLFAFYLAYKNQAKGYLINEFRRKFLSEAKKREDELYKTFYGIHKSITIPNKIKGKLMSIFKEELL
jgi:hypothetical protein